MQAPPSDHPVTIGSTRPSRLQSVMKDGGVRCGPGSFGQLASSQPRAMLSCLLLKFKIILHETLDSFSLPADRYVEPSLKNGRPHGAGQVLADTALVARKEFLAA